MQQQAKKETAPDINEYKVFGPFELKRKKENGKWVLDLEAKTEFWNNVLEKTG